MTDAATIPTLENAGSRAGRPQAAEGKVRVLNLWWQTQRDTALGTTWPLYGL